MNTVDVISDINSFYEDKMRECEMTDEEQYRIYEMFLEWYPEVIDIPDDIEDSDIDSIREDLWEEFCGMANVEPREVHFSYPPLREGFDNEED